MWLVVRVSTILLRGTPYAMCLAHEGVADSDISDEPMKMLCKSWRLLLNMSLSYSNLMYSHLINLLIGNVFKNATILFI